MTGLVGWKGNAGEQILQSPPSNSKHRGVCLDQSEWRDIILPLVTAIRAEEKEWEKNQLAVINRNELQKEVVRYDMPTWGREKNWIKPKKLAD